MSGLMHFSQWVLYKSRFIGVNITNLQQLVSVFELYRKLLGDNAPVRDRHCPFSFLSVIRFTFECFPDCDIRDFLRLVAFLNILDGVETVLLNISESRKQDGTAVYIYPTIVKIDSIAVFPTCMGWTDMSAIVFRAELSIFKAAIVVCPYMPFNICQSTVFREEVAVFILVVLYSQNPFLYSIRIYYEIVPVASVFLFQKPVFTSVHSFSQCPCQTA